MIFSKILNFVFRIQSFLCGIKWHHIVTVFNEKGKPRMYVDGVPCRRTKDKVFGSRWYYFDECYFVHGCWIKTIRRN